MNGALLGQACDLVPGRQASILEGGAECPWVLLPNWLKYKPAKVGVFGTAIAPIADMTIVPRLAFVALLALGACAVDEVSMSSDEKADSSQVIAYHRPDAPTMIEFSTAEAAPTSSHSIAFGHCETPTEGDDGAINIDCNEKWSELAWLSISKETSEGLIAKGATSLSLDVSVTTSTADTDSVRLSVHAIDANGRSFKIASEGNVFDGDAIAVDLDIAEYHVFMARGENNFLVWHNGSIEVDLTTRFE